MTSDDTSDDGLPWLPDEVFLTARDGDDAPERPTLSFRRSPSVLLTFAANRFTRLASRSEQELHGIGAMDWRMLVMLTREPGATLVRSSDTIGIDKAAVSRCLKRLEKWELVRSGDLHANGRSRGWWLTPKGQDLHDRILGVALTRQRNLLRGFSREEVELLASMLRRLLDNLDLMKADPALQPKEPHRKE